MFALNHLNVPLFLEINGLAGRAHLLDQVMIFLAKDAIGIVPLFLLYLWFRKSDRDESKLRGLWLLTAAILSWALAYGISIIYFHPRPFMIGLGKKLISHPPDASFPSDHVTVLSSLAFALFYLRSRLAATAFLLLAFLVGFARVFCGIHFPFDVTGGVATGFAGAILAWQIRVALSPVYSRVIKIYRGFFRG